MIDMPTTKFMTDQIWAYIYLVTGCVMVIIAHHLNIDNAIGAGIIGAGINAFTATQKPPSAKES